MCGNVGVCVGLWVYDCVVLLVQVWSCGCRCGMWV